MFTVDAKYNISITRGDTATLELTFTGDVPGENDRVIASLKKNPKKADEIWEKELELYGSGTGDDGEPYTTYLLELASADTEGQAFGGYFWDLRILYADGQITTPFPPAAFNVLEVVTDLPE